MEGAGRKIAGRCTGSLSMAAAIRSLAILGDKQAIIRRDKARSPERGCSDAIIEERGERRAALVKPQADELESLQSACNPLSDDKHAIIADK